MTEPKSQTTPPPIDLTHRLRVRIQRSHVAGDKWSEIPDPLCQAAADEIGRLTAALEEIAGLTQFVGDDPVNIARAALGVKKITNAD